jgi:NADH:ubiquinone oxidoreductase subunit 4 (subunit M)
MQFLDNWLLLLILFWPLVSALLIIFAKDDRVIKWGSVGASLLPLGLSIYMMAAYDWASGAMAPQWTVQADWIPALNASFHLGVDGLSVPMIFLTTLLSTLSIYYSTYVIKLRVKEYFIMFHLLEFSMIGVFMALDYGALLRLLGDQPRANVPADWHLGRQESQLRLNQVLYLYIGWLRFHAACHSGHLFCHADL